MKISIYVTAISCVLLAGFSGCKPQDNKIKTAIDNKYQYQPALAIVTTNVSKGVVTLSGTVGSDSERKVAESIAQNINGVESVINQIAVDHTNSLTTAVIKDEILIEETDLILKSFPGVKETVNSGVITLSGHVSASRKPALMDTIRTLFPSDINDQLTIK